MHRTPRFLLAVLVVLPLALSACGGDDLASKSAPDVLAETFGPDKPVTSGKLDLRVALDAKGLQGVDGPLKLALTGPFASAGEQEFPRFDFDADLDVGGQALAVGAVSTGEKGWLKVAGENFAVSDTTFRQFRGLYAQDQKRAATADAPTLQALGVDPERWLASPEKAGEETVGGAETVHVTSEVDVPALLEDVDKLLARADATGAANATGTTGRVPSGLTDAQREQIQASVKRTSLDVYAGKDDGTLRRLNLQVAFDVPAEARAGAGGLATGTLSLDLVITELNEEQEIAGPRTARPLSDLTRTGTTGATGATGTQAQPADPGSAETTYRECVDAAGESIAEVQKCAPLLNGG